VSAQVSVDQANQDQRRAAQKTFEAGDDLYEAGRYAEALTAFRASHDLVASPNSRLMVARCLRELGRYAQAHRELERTISASQASAGRYAEAAEAAVAEQAALAQHVTFIVLPRGRGVESFRIAEDSYSADQVGERIAAMPGEVIVSFHINGEERSVTLDAQAQGLTEVDVDGDAEAELPLKGVPKVEAEEPAPVHVESGSGERGSYLHYAIAGSGVALIGGAGFLVFGSLSNSQYETLEDSCPADRCPPDRQESIDKGKRYQLYANVSLGVGVMGLATAAVFYLLEPAQEQDAPTVGLTSGPGWVGVGGRF
jgi:hypothetical protein